MGIMKLTLLTVTFAATLAAQQQAPDPRVELAPVIAVEEQERDLPKAEQLYRDALAGGELSAVGRALASRRLGNLLVRLGRDAEAKPFLDAAARSGSVAIDGAPAAQGQGDAAREQALRAQARALVRQVVDANATHGNHDGATLHGIGQDVAEQLLWLGEAAVPEVIAALETMRTATGYNPAVGASLAAFLWRVGGAKATAFLREAQRDPRLRSMVAESASSLRAPELLDVAAAYLRDTDPEVALDVLGSMRWGPRLGDRMPVAVLFDALQVDATRQRWLLRWDTQQSLDAETLAKLVPIAKQALASTDPELAAAAMHLLRTPAARTSPAMVALLLEQLPMMLANGMLPANTPYQAPRARDGRWTGPFDAADASALLPKLEATVRRLGDAGKLSPQARTCVEGLMFDVMMPLSMEPALLGWFDQGFTPMQPVLASLTADNAKAILARWGRLSTEHHKWLLDALGRIDLPRELFATLRELAETSADADLPAASFTLALARTGHADAAAWILARWQEDVTRSRARELLVLCGRNDAEPVRAAVRTAILLPEVSDQDRAALLLTLLAKGDALALDLVAKWPMVAGDNPLTTGGPDLTPLQYLLYDDLEPQRQFTDAQVCGVLAALTAAKVRIRPAQMTVGAIPDRLLAKTATATDDPDWFRVAWQRLVDRNFTGPLDTFLTALLHDPQADPKVWTMPTELCAHYRPELEALLDGPSDSVAGQVASELMRLSPPPDLDRLLRSPHGSVRSAAIEEATTYVAAVRRLLKDDRAVNRLKAAQRAGAAVDKDAVPDLIELLRDPEEDVRQAAAESLQRIRFYHEQQAHWDRVLHGLDASPATATEKLLLQSKPGAPREQRLLAIRSLGTLGAPEALPFLIDWTTDADEPIAAAARDAIGEIHLHPRR